MLSTKVLMLGKIKSSLGHALLISPKFVQILILPFGLGTIIGFETTQDKQ